jgi:hypothetical protein
MIKVYLLSLVIYFICRASSISEVESLLAGLTNAVTFSHLFINEIENRCLSLEKQIGKLQSKLNINAFE